MRLRISFLLLFAILCILTIHVARAAEEDDDEATAPDTNTSNDVSADGHEENENNQVQAASDQGDQTDRNAISAESLENDATGPAEGGEPATHGEDTENTDAQPERGEHDRSSTDDENTGNPTEQDSAGGSGDGTGVDTDNTTSIKEENTDDAPPTDDSAGGAGDGTGVDMDPINPSAHNDNTNTDENTNEDTVIGASNGQETTDDDDNDNTDAENMDTNVRADEESLQKVEHEREELAKKLHVVELLKKRMATKNRLLKRVRDLQEKESLTASLEHGVREEKETAEENYRLAVMRRNATADEREHTAREREEMEKVLEELKSEKKSFEEEFAKLSADKTKKKGEEEDLKKKKQELMENLEVLVRRFRYQGFHRWLEYNMHDLPPVVRETILKTGNTLNPVLEGMEEIGYLNDEISKEAMRYMPSIRKNPFYSGLLFYLFLLFPTVTVMWVAIRVRQRLALLTVEHYVIALNLYFGVMSSVCAVMTLIAGGRDVLATLRQESKHIAEPFMIIHGIFFVAHLILHGLTAYVSGSRKDFAQYLVMSCIGLHFFTHAYKRTILNRDPNIGAPAYILYALAFLYVLYDRGIHIIEAVIRGRKAGLSAFGTFPKEYDMKASLVSNSLPTTNSNQAAAVQAADLPQARIHPSIVAGAKRQQGPSTPGDTTVYFAGLPVFNAPSQSTLSDAKTM